MFVEIYYKINGQHTCKTIEGTALEALGIIANLTATGAEITTVKCYNYAE